MKKLTLLVCALAIGMFASCKNDVKSPGDTLPEGTTYMGLSIRLPGGPAAGSRALKERYNGHDSIKTVDVYLLSADGQSIVYSHRYNGTNTEINYTSGDDTTGPVLHLAQPFTTQPGDMGLIVVVNCPQPMISAPPSADYMYSLSSALPLSALASISTDPNVVTNVTGYGDVYPDIVTISGRYQGTFNIEDNVTSQEVISEGTNHVTLDIIRVPTRVSVTTDNLTPTVVNDAGETLGTIDDINWSVGQGSNQVYLFRQPVAGLTDKWRTPGYDYIPGTDYAATAPQWYDYSDLVNTTDAVPLNPGADYIKYLPGKFLLENTHPEGATQAASGYRQGNTAYVLVRVKFTPDPSVIADGGTLASDGTFYVGATDGQIYSDIDASHNSTTGTVGQQTYTYEGGKMLYYLWLNPDVVEKPINSTVVRNSIYHINIRSFKDLGFNWNPLNPSTNNPDPRPDNPDEPDTNPMDPTFPLSPTDTYMTVDATIVPWYVYSYGIDL